MARHPRTQERKRLRNEIFGETSGGSVWPQADERGWFRAPRTLPLVLNLLSSKEFNEGKDLCRTYLALLAVNYDEGIITLEEKTLAAASGFSGERRAVRSWRERMDLLEKAGFIQMAPRGNERYGFALVKHPHQVVRGLRSAGRMPDGLWNQYQELQISSAGAPPPPSPLVASVTPMFGGK